MGALEAALLLFVVEDELIAQAAGGLGEMRAGLVGVGTVGGQYPGREAERDEGGEGMDGVGPGPFAGGVQDEAERELRMPADALTRLRVSGGVSAAGGDEQGGAVPEDAFLRASAEVPARGEFHGGQLASFVGRMVPGGDRGGVDTDIASPALEQATAVGETHGDQDQTVADLLQKCPTPYMFGVRVLPGCRHVYGFVGGQPTAPVTAVWIEGAGEVVEGTVDAAGERVPGMVIKVPGIGDAQPGPRGRAQFIEQNSAGIGEARAVVVVQRQQQAHQRRPHWQSLRAGTSLELCVDQVQHSGGMQQGIQLPDLGVRDLDGRVGDRPRPAQLDLLQAPPGPGLGHACSGPRSSRAAVEASMGGTRCCQRAREAAEASPAACAIRW